MSKNLDQTKQSILINTRTNLAPEIVKTEGAGKAYQSVAQSMAIAVQDATDNLRNITTISSTAIAVCTQLMIAERKVTPYAEIIAKSQETLSSTVKIFEKVGKSSGTILKEFPSGDS
ncbi:MAG: hypothetical protein F6K40_31085 [Okeania sp. SIO3I5]|uniref:hypothetical protein n=1 Tax=Okeania sp. SIO3I5 TaxID=2607805 RepID=UPI0013BA062C|nr:hypothetical protein [Okeania sp. SIO3I5]NEQ40436.1 hypothetical protein [Okeania sp. SIO3I5]